MTLAREVFATRELHHSEFHSLRLLGGRGSEAKKERQKQRMTHGGPTTEVEHNHAPRTATSGACSSAAGSTLSEYLRLARATILHPLKLRFLPNRGFDVGQTLFRRLRRVPTFALCLRHVPG